MSLTTSRGRLFQTLHQIVQLSGFRPSERGAPFTKAGFARMVERAGGGRKLAPHEWRCGPTADGGRACRTSSFLRKHLTLYFVFRCGPSALTRNDFGVR